jgi:hypothetical protein
MSKTNGGPRRSPDKVRVAIIGVGNCASSLVQGVQYYRDADPAGTVPGLMHVDLGGYHVKDIEFSAAFDVNAGKVGKDLSQAILAAPNNTYRFADVPPLGVKVLRGPMPGKLTPGTPSYWNGTSRPCQWIEESSSRSFVTDSLTFVPSLRRISGPGTVPLIPIPWLCRPSIVIIWCAIRSGMSVPDTVGSARTSPADTG